MKFRNVLKPLRRNKDLLSEITRLLQFDTQSESLVQNKWFAKDLKLQKAVFFYYMWCVVCYYMIFYWNILGGTWLNDLFNQHKRRPIYIYSVYNTHTYSRLTYVPRQFSASLLHFDSSLSTGSHQPGIEGNTLGSGHISKLGALLSDSMSNKHTLLLYPIICKCELVNCYNHLNVGCHETVAILLCSSRSGEGFKPTTFSYVLSY